MSFLNTKFPSMETTPSWLLLLPLAYLKVISWQQICFPHPLSRTLFLLDFCVAKATQVSPLTNLQFPSLSPVTRNFLNSKLRYLSLLSLEKSLKYKCCCWSLKIKVKLHEKASYFILHKYLHVQEDYTHLRICECELTCICLFVSFYTSFVKTSKKRKKKSRIGC